MKTSYHPSLPLNAKAQRRKDKPATPEAAPQCSAPWRLGVLALNFIRAALLVTALALLPAATRADGAIEAWVQRYDSPSNGSDTPSAMIMDNSGNVIVTGYSADSGSGDDFATIKYSSGGEPLWTNRYNGPGNTGDWPWAVAVDMNGNVYVTGGSVGSDSGADYATIKYSSTGVPLWTNRYNGPGNRDDFGGRVAVDASGNVVVTGYSWGSASGYDYATIKYSSAGVPLWTNRYNGTGNGEDSIRDMAMDTNGNVYVTGLSYGSGGNNDYATVAYSSAGVPLWTNRYNGPDNSNDGASGVAVDASGNVIVTGGSRSIGGGFDCATIKYSGSGVQLWARRYNGLGNGDDFGDRLAVDASGNVYVTGRSRSGSGASFTTIAYSSTGLGLWTNRYAAPASTSTDSPTGIALDAAGNVIVTGWTSTSDGYDDFTTIAYSSAGVARWTNWYNGPASRYDEARAVAVDAAGSVYVTGNSQSSTGGSDFATVKYVTLPIITRQPLSWTNAVGTTASFAVEATSTTPLSYQWRLQGTNLLDGGNLSGVTSTNLLIANVQVADAGGYSAVASNTWGSVTSSVAQLTVYVPPNPGRFTHLSYSPDTGFSFIFRDATVGKPYRIQTSPSLAEGSWVDWMNFNYTGPMLLSDMEAVGTTNRFYRAISP